MQSMLWKRLATALCIGLIVILTLGFVDNRTDRAEGNPHNIWTHSDGFNNLHEVIRFLNDKHLYKFQIVTDKDGLFRVIYED